MNIERDLIDYLSNVAGKRNKSASAIEVDVSFIDSGILDSLQLLDFVNFVEKRFDIRVPGEDIIPEHFGTLGAVTNYLRKRLMVEEHA